MSKGPLTEGNTRGGHGAVKSHSASGMKPPTPPAPKPQQKNDEVEQLKKEIEFLNEQLWFTQEAMRKLMIELTNHLGAQGAEAVIGLMAEWSQIVHDINYSHEKM